MLWRESFERLDLEDTRRVREEEEAGERAD